MNLPKETENAIWTVVIVLLATAARLFTDKINKASEIIGKLVVSAFVAIVVDNLAKHYTVPENIRVPIIGICSYLASDLLVWLKHTWEDYGHSFRKIGKALLQKHSGVDLLEDKKPENDGKE
jgi:carbon starvation protein CstA